MNKKIPINRCEHFETNSGTDVTPMLFKKEGKLNYQSQRFWKANRIF